MDQIEPYASQAPYQVVVGNHEYDWKTGTEKKHHHHPVDASGTDEAYDPQWGNYGKAGIKSHHPKAAASFSCRSCHKICS